MKQVWSIVKLAAKWSIILGAIYVATTFFSGLDFESRTGLFLAALAMAIAYVDGNQKDRIANLEFRVDELTRRIDL
ncbi:MAG: hypothetical protein JWO45_1843 [Spartobacteria bacterium]|nr:hypothetical protein [Spartobacteria bacterium]